MTTLDLVKVKWLRLKIDLVKVTRWKFLNTR